MSNETNTVLVTGCNRGIGLEFVKQYLLLNWKVIATCRNPEKADDLIDLSIDYPHLLLHPLDITKESSVNALAGEIGDLPIDMLINNACLLYTSPSPRDATLSRMPSSA